MRQKAPAALRLPGRARWSASRSLRVAPLRAAHRSLPANTPGQSRRGKPTSSCSNSALLFLGAAAAIGRVIASLPPAVGLEVGQEQIGPGVEGTRELLLTIGDQAVAQLAHVS